MTSFDFQMKNCLSDFSKTFHEVFMECFFESKKKRGKNLFEFFINKKTNERWKII